MSTSNKVMRPVPRLKHAENHQNNLLDQNLSKKKVPSQFLISTTKSLPGAAEQGRLNYASDERAFRRTDIPSSKLKNKSKVIAYKQKDRLGLLKPSWNATATIDQKEKQYLYELERSKYIKSYGGTINTESIAASTSLSASLPRKLPSMMSTSISSNSSVNQTLTKPHARLLNGNSTLTARCSTAPAATIKDHQSNLSSWAKPQPKNVYDELEWNHTTSIDRSLIASKHFVETKVAKQTSKSRTEKILALSKSGRKTLKQLETEKNERIREAKLNARDPEWVARQEAEAALEELRKQSEERKRRREMRKQIIGRENFSGLERKKEYAYSHSGAWEHSRIENMFVWSCCLATKKDSRGCSKTLKFAESWNLESF